MASASGRWKRKKFWTRAFGITLALTLLFFVLIASITQPYVRIVFLLIAVLIPAHHALAQSFGLSLLYNQRPKSESETARAEKTERRLARLFLVIFLTANCFLILAPSLALGGKTNSTVWSLLSWASVVVAVLLMAAMFTYPGALRWKKLLFSFRYAVWMLTFISPIAVAGTKVVHGIEYALVTKRVIGRSTASTLRQTVLMLVVFVVVLGVFRESFQTAFFQKKRSRCG